jgi:ferrous-iron efflux pump FieF
MPASSTLQTRTASTTVKVAGGLLAIKLLTFLATGSSGVLGSALDSGLDMMASLVVLWAVSAAARPADADHPYGHGKAESLASLLQSVFILISGLALAYHSIERFVSNLQGEPPRLEQPGLGIGVMLFSALVTLWLVRRLRRVATETGSPALKADSAHYASDLLMNLSVVVGLGLHKLLDGAVWPDLLVGVIIALIILNTAREVFTGATGMLMDKGLEPAEEAAILETVLSFAPKIAGFHDLRSRRSGAETFVEVHLDIPRGLSFVEAHDLAEEVGAAVEAQVPRCQVTVHADPL